MRLYEIAERFRAWFEEIEALDGEVTDLHAVELSELEGDLREKVEACAVFMRSQDAQAAAIGEEIKRLQARKRACEAAEERVRQALIATMVATGQTKVKTALFSVSVRDSQGEVVVSDEALVPDEYFRVKRELSRSAMREALKGGAEIPGAELRINKTVVVK